MRSGLQVGEIPQTKDMIDKEGQRTMTLADFLKVFDFDHGNKVEIFSLFSGEETYAGTYFTESEVEKDFCTVIYNVVSIRPISEFTIQVVIWR